MTGGTRNRLRSAFDILPECYPGRPLVIRDMKGPVSVTNDAENVVDYLLRNELLDEGQRLMYYDSYGELDEIIIMHGKFAGFAPGPGRKGIGEYNSSRR